ncbi:hypothetical protein GCM10010123_37180 [Pilimelia anulata]|uniref:Uncharacterized protein n=1 Tax=Pilimelia anulata TaxID=53371 RepID=A0A8J3BCF3_9ACTN|nr:hypothetical protein [Pilimelia anulata]GGK03807.1 hypothetical protein GCM10010123_37180 [Pilimelia anulata]
MRTKKALAALVVGCAALAPAALAPSPAAAASGLVNISIKDAVNGNQVAILNNLSIPVAAAVCVVDVDVLTKQLADVGKADCPAQSNSKQVATVVNAIG